MKLWTLALALLVGCASPPRPAADLVWYQREPNLQVQADAYKAHAIALIDSSGVLCFRGYLPWGPEGDEWTNYQDSHDLADVPAWQGYLIAALAFEAATTGVDNDKTIADLTAGLLTFFDVSGVEGLLGRSHFAEYTGPRLAWMGTREEDSAKYWDQGPGGRWWRNGVAKDHWNLTCFGAGVALALDRQGRIHLTGETRDALVRLLVGAVRHLVANGYRVLDANGEMTEFGDLRPNAAFGPDWPEIAGLPNGFNRTLVLSALRSASFYDTDLSALYEKVGPEWGPGIGTSMEAVGEFVSRVGHYRFDKPSFSDMQAYSLAVLALLMQEDRREFIEGPRGGMSGLWEFMRYERNAAFTMVHALVRPVDTAAPMIDVIQDLRSFPRPEDKGTWAVTYRETSHAQPLGARPTNSNYWKSSPFRRVTWAPGSTPPEPTRHGTTGARQHQAGMDYLLAYWLGRHLGIVPVE